MKQRISIDDLKKLSATQRAHLLDLWIPARYSLAVANVCVNAETNEYTYIEFCIGSARITKNGNVRINDLHSSEGFMRIPADEDEFDEPSAFNQYECLPLLSIGEMMELMERRNFSGFHFYLLAGTGEHGCEVGNFKSELKTKILSGDYEKAELCDVLWQMIVAQL